MFDIGASELLVIVIVAILVIGPKDMPRAMRTAGRWIGKLRRMSTHFRAGIDEMVRQAVEWHPWMLLSGPADDATKQTIEHDGE